MTVTDIITEANNLIEDQFDPTIAIAFVQMALDKFNSIAGIMIPTIPKGSAGLNYTVTYTEKLGPVAKSDPDYKEKQTEVDNFNRKMETIDNTINRLVLVMGTAYYMKKNDVALQEIPDWENNFYGNINEVITSYRNTFDPNYLLDHMMGNQMSGGRIFTSKGSTVPGHNLTPAQKYADYMKKKSKLSYKVNWRHK